MTPYETLGVAPTASDAEIKSAYRRLARKLHPDLNPNDAQAEERFKDVSSAYRIVGDAQARKRYDAGEIDSAGNEQPQQRYYRDYADSDDAHQYANQGGFAGFDGFENAAGGGFDQNDIFAELLRRQRAQQANRRGQDVHYRLGLSLAEAINGGTRRIDLAGGGTLDITIPKNVVAGQTLRLKGKGATGAGSGAAGDALIELDVLPDARFQAQGADLVHELPISLREAVLGGKVRVPTPSGQAEVTIAPMSSSGTALRLKGMGAPLRGGRRGDELVRLKIVLPKTPDPELTRFVEGWANGEASNPREETRT